MYFKIRNILDYSTFCGCKKSLTVIVYFVVTKVLCDDDILVIKRWNYVTRQLKSLVTICQYLDIMMD